jgi:hypothetical protein
MKLVVLAMTMVALPALAQTRLVKEFPAGATALAPEAMKARFTPGTEFAFRSTEGYEVRMNFQEGGQAIVAAPIATEAGRWRIDGSSVCFEFRRFPSGCNEVKAVGDALYWKRVSNDEVVKLEQK